MKNERHKAQVYSSMLAIATGLLALHFIFKIRYLDYAALVILVIALVSFPLASLITIGWTKLAEVLGYINSRIILSLVFYLFLFPISLLYRLFNKDKLRLKKRPEAKSYFLKRDHSYQPDDLDKPW